MDMGLNGVAQLSATGVQGGNDDSGRAMGKPVLPRPYWLYYVHVDFVETSVARIEAVGGLVPVKPHQVPGGRWIASGLDTQGAVFAVYCPR